MSFYTVSMILTETDYEIYFVFCHNENLRFLLQQLDILNAKTDFSTIFN
jgi:hypothetical protein